MLRSAACRLPPPLPPPFDTTLLRPLPKQMADDEGFGGLEPVLLAQEEKLAAFAEENRVLGAAVESLQAKLKAAEGRAAAATKRASEAEARLHARSAAERGVAQQLADKQQEAERLRHRLANETLLREQVRGGRASSPALLPLLSAARMPAALACPDAFQACIPLP